MRSPLDEAGLTKAEIRELSREVGLPTWDEPASACLSSRIPYLSEVTEPKLQMIERAEEALRGLGFRCAACGTTTTSPASRSAARRCRARSIPRPTPRSSASSRRAGYKYVSLDLQGYRTGSLNEVLVLTPA